MAEALPKSTGLDVEKYPVAPEGLQLEQVHVFVRHGERTPVGVRMSDPPANIPEQWELCKTARQFGDSQQLKKLVERKDGSLVDSDCLLGELTDTGRKSTFAYGTSLRKIYIDKLRFLPDTLDDRKKVYLRTTNMPRTTESLQQVVNGLYPTSKCSPDAVPSILVRNGRDENLIGNTSSCKRLEALLVGFAQAAATAYNPTLEPLDKKISKYIGGKPVRVDGKPRASGIMDTIRAASAHGIKIPPEFEEKSVVETLERAIVTEWFSGYKTEEVRRLGMGRMLEDISSKMQHKVEHGDKDPLKILVHSTHDTGLAAVAQPSMCSMKTSVTFELFKKIPSPNRVSVFQHFMSPFTTTKPEYFVRMRYQNRNLPLPMCSDEGKHLPGSPEFCTLDAFRSRVKELTPVDWDAECSMSR